MGNFGFALVSGAVLGLVISGMEKLSKKITPEKKDKPSGVETVDDTNTTTTTTTTVQEEQTVETNTTDATDSGDEGQPEATPIKETESVKEETTAKAAEPTPAPRQSSRLRRAPVTPNKPTAKTKENKLTQHVFDVEWDKIKKKVSFDPKWRSTDGWMEFAKIANIQQLDDEQFGKGIDDKGCKFIIYRMAKNCNWIIFQTKPGSSEEIIGSIPFTNDELKNPLSEEMIHKLIAGEFTPSKETE